MVRKGLHIDTTGKQEISLKKIFGWISMVEFVLYVLLFVIQGHSTWENIIKSLTMQTDQ